MADSLLKGKVEDEPGALRAVPESTEMLKQTNKQNQKDEGPDTEARLNEFPMAQTGTT